MRRISVVVLSVLLMLALAATMAALPTFAEENGNSGTNDGFGSVASQVATNKGPNTGTDGKGGLGEHSSSQEEPRQGVGNVARTDDAKGDHPGDHGCFVGQQMNVDCNDKPGKGGK